MILAAARELSVTGPSAVAVAGDTPSDMRTGVAAGAGLVAGVLTGTSGPDDLRAAGATHVLTTVAELPELLRLTRRAGLPWNPPTIRGMV